MRTPLALLLAVLAALLAAPAALAADPLRAQQWGLDTIEADAARATSTGSGTVVAVLDTGVLVSHEDLIAQLLPGFDVIDEDETPQDGDGHGTHVTGIIAASAGNGKGIEGVAPGVKILPIRVLDDNGEGTGEGVAKGIDYAVAHNADVINLSLGGDAIGTILGGDEAYTKALQNALDKGVVVIMAAGNETAPFCEQPALSGPVLCVGATDRRNMRSFYSSSGDLVAPGGSAFGGPEEDILSTYNDGKYAEIAGTSQATPHVAGVAALLVSLGLDGPKVVERILATSTDAGVPGRDDVYGAGILNARAAVEGLKPPSGGGGGGGGGGAGGGGGSPTGPGISFRRTQRISTVLKRGVRVRCRAGAAGKCKVRVRARGKLIARGSAAVTAGGKATVSAKVTRAGRKMLRGASRRRARLLVDVPGASARIERKLTLVG